MTQIQKLSYWQFISAKIMQFWTKQFCCKFFNNIARGKPYIIYALWFKQINKVERQMS